MSIKDVLSTKIETPECVRAFFAFVNRRIEKPVAQFFAVPYSPWAAAFVAFGVGMISPICLPILETDEFNAVWVESFRMPWKSCILAGVLLGLIYFKSKWQNFQFNSSAITGAALSVVLVAASLLTSYYCCLLPHLCMGGHHLHEPFGSKDYLADISWSTGLIIAAIVQIRCRIPSSTAFAFVAGFLISLRFIFGSFGGRLWYI